MDAIQYRTMQLLLLFSCSVVSNSLRPYGVQYARLFHPSLSSGIRSNSCPLSQWCYLTISYSATHFLTERHRQTPPLSGGQAENPTPLTMHLVFQWPARILNCLCCCCSVAKSCLTLCNPMDWSMQGLSFATSWSLLKPMSIESVMPSKHLILCCPLLLLPSIFSSNRIFSTESVLCIRWPKNWSFSFSSSPSSEHSGLISFRIDWFYLPCSPRDSQESSAPQFESINSSALNLLYVQTLISMHDYWKNHSFDYADLCHQGEVSAF